MAETTTYVKHCSSLKNPSAPAALLFTSHERKTFWFTHCFARELDTVVLDRCWSCGEWPVSMLSDACQACQTPSILKEKMSEICGQGTDKLLSAHEEFVPLNSVVLLKKIS